MMTTEHVSTFHQLVKEEAVARNTDEISIMDYLLINPSLAQAVFRVLLEQGVPLTEIKDQLTLSGAMVAPQYEF